VDPSTRIAKERIDAIAEFFNVVNAWHLKDSEARELIGVSASVFRQMKRGKNEMLEQDKLARISLLIGIFKGLNILYSRSQADAWVHMPNSNLMFDREPPLKYMIKGGVEALARVRQLLGVWSGYFPAQK
jgi:hypothetical protein